MKPNENVLLSLLSSNDVTFFIPPYQRNYEWDTEQCEIFFKDIVETTNRNRAEEETQHFFGSVTYFQDETAFGQPNKLVLIDGQQRITTTMLFLVAMRDLIDDQATKDFIDNSYLRNNKVADDTEYKIKLKQVETDWKAYCDIILGNDIEDKQKKTAVYKNYLYFKKQLANAIERNPYPATELIEKGLDKFSIITIELEKKNSWENPQEIFESMNSLGKPLSLADLVRNYLLLGLPADQQEKLYNKYWLNMEDRLTNISNFIRDFMQLKAEVAYNKATEQNYKKLYGDFKEFFGDEDKDQLIQDMNFYSKFYAYIVMGTDCGNDAVNDKLADIREIGATTSYSFILGLLCSWGTNKLNDKELLDLLDVICIFFIRRRVIGLSGAENKVFPTLAKRIREIESASDKRETMFNILSNQESSMRLPNDVEMVRDIQAMNFYNFRYARFILSLIEEKLTKSRPDPSDNKLQIEHIMPQTLSDEWEKALGENANDIHQELCNNIGNLTLIRHNQELGQKPFNEKKDIYENNAGLQIAKSEITNQTKWNKDTIENRQNWMIERLLYDVLPIPDSKRKTNNFSSNKSRGLSFMELQLIGETITYCKDRSITAKVVSDTEVSFEGKNWKLSPLTRELETRRGTVTASGSYSGAQYWEYEGIRLSSQIGG